MDNNLEEMRKELIRLIKDQEGLIGDDRKQANRKLIELQDRIDHAKKVNRMNNNIREMELELDRLVHLREGAVGIDLKRTNYKIAELQNKIDHADLMEQIEEGKKDDVKIQDFEELAEELGI